MISTQGLAEFNRKKLDKFENAYGENKGNNTLQGAREIWRRVVAVHNPPKCFFINCVLKSDSFVSDEI